MTILCFERRNISEPVIPTATLTVLPSKVECVQQLDLLIGHLFVLPPHALVSNPN